VDRLNYSLLQNSLLITMTAPREAGFTTTTDVPLYWCAYGTPGARRLLVLHGGPGADHGYLLPQMLALAEDHELVFYDQRGGGRSRTDDPTPITWQTHVEDLAAVAHELDFNSLEILGYSWGGLLAMLYAVSSVRGSPFPVPGSPFPTLDRDTLVADGGDGVPSRAESPVPSPQSLVLLDPAPITRAYREQFEAEFSRRQQGEVIQRLRDELARSNLRDRDPDAYRHRAFELSVAGYFADPTRARELTPFRVIGRVQQSVWASLGDFDLRPHLERVTIPTLIVHGREDPIPLASSQEAADALRARLVVLEDCGHVPYVEQPQSLFDAVREFLANTTPFPRGEAP
jgi:proline iminopeptidase